MTQHQLVGGHGQQISRQQDPANGDLPVIGATVDVDPDGLLLIGAGEADLVVDGLLELDVAQPQGLVLLAQLAQTAVVVLKLPLLNNLGSLTGGMTSTPALGTLINVAKTEDVAAAYAATYPIALIAVVLVSQFLILMF